MSSIDLGGLLEKQIQLDEMIEENKNLRGEDLLNYKLLALIAEVGEAINECRVFKYWSEDRGIRKDSLLEELADCLHFILSIAHDVGILSLPVKRSLPDSDAVIKDPITSFLYLSNVVSEFATTKDVDLFEIIIEEFIGTVTDCGFSLDELEQAYIQKNHVNKIRQHSGY